MHIEDRLDTARGIIRKLFDEYDDIMVCFTGGKDSGMLLHLIESTIDDPDHTVLFIDHGLHFEEVTEYANAVAGYYGYEEGEDFVVARNDAILGAVDRDADAKAADGSAAQSVPVEDLPDAQQTEVERLVESGWERPPNNAIPWSTNSQWGNHMLKTWPLHEATADAGADAVAMAIRADEGGERDDAEPFEPAPHPEMEHTRCHPLVSITLPMLWAYTKKEMIHGPAYNVLYDQGYSSLGASPWTEPSRPNSGERSGRAQDKQQMMAQLREEGYM